MAGRWVAKADPPTASTRVSGRFAHLFHSTGFPVRSTSFPCSARRPQCTPRVVSDLPAVRRVALEALQDMRSNNVRYAELRTTPRPLADGTSRRDYIENVLQVFRDFEINQAARAPDVSRDGASSQESLDLGEGGSELLPAGRLIPRLLLSVDRGKSTEEAMEVAKLARELRSSEEWKLFVLGVDFSGNPTKGSFEAFRSDQRTGSREGRQSRCVHKLTHACAYAHAPDRSILATSHLP